MKWQLLWVIFQHNRSKQTKNHLATNDGIFFGAWALCLAHYDRLSFTLFCSRFFFSLALFCPISRPPLFLPLALSLSHFFFFKLSLFSHPLSIASIQYRRGRRSPNLDQHNWHWALFELYYCEIMRNKLALTFTKITIFSIDPHIAKQRQLYWYLSQQHCTDMKIIIWKVKIINNRWNIPGIRMKENDSGNRTKFLGKLHRRKYIDGKKSRPFGELCREISCLEMKIILIYEHKLNSSRILIDRITNARENKNEIRIFNQFEFDWIIWNSQWDLSNWNFISM